MVERYSSLFLSKALSAANQSTPPSHSLPYRLLLILETTGIGSDDVAGFIFGAHSKRMQEQVLFSPPVTTTSQKT